MLFSFRGASKERVPLACRHVLGVALEGGASVRVGDCRQRDPEDVEIHWRRITTTAGSLSQTAITESPSTEARWALHRAGCQPYTANGLRHAPTQRPDEISSKEHSPARSAREELEKSNVPPPRVVAMVRVVSRPTDSLIHHTGTHSRRRIREVVMPRQVPSRSGVAASPSPGPSPPLVECLTPRAPLQPAQPPRRR
jgi:hypothetical protein